MLRLKNIRINNTTAEADFYPEDDQLFGHIIIALDAEEIATCENVPGYGESYKTHAMYRLLQMVKDKDMRTECLVMWY